MPDPSPSPSTSTSPSSPLVPVIDATTSLHVRKAASALVDALREEASKQAGKLEDSQGMFQALTEIGELRGQPAALPLLSAGAGKGAAVVLADGRAVLDLVSGIGPYAFGHDDQDLLETAAIAAARDVAFQGHVLPGPEYLKLSQTLTRLAGPNLQHVWLSLSGSMANENAWKILLQKKAPASRCLAFEHSFHGRTLAMAELTDRPEYREGLPPMDFVDRIPFFDPSDPESTDKSVAALKQAIAASPGQHAAMCFELVQGEGGFNDAPSEFFRALMTACKDAGIAIWLDEIQTFGRTKGLFAFRTLGLSDLVDIVTVGKILHGSATLFTAELRPKPKLVAGTWAGASVGMAIGARILERLENEGYLGDSGKIAKLTDAIDDAFDALSRRLPGVVTARSGLGAMQAFTAWEGNAEVATAIIETALEEGVLLQTAGSKPMKIRLLPPLNLTSEELARGFAAIERALKIVAARFDLPIG